MYVVITYNSEAVCGSPDAEFNAFGPYTYEQAYSASARICTENGVESEVLILTPDVHDALFPSLVASIRDALEGDSNDAEHDALVSVAEFLHIDYEGE